MQNEALDVFEDCRAALDEIGGRLRPQNSPEFFKVVSVIDKAKARLNATMSKLSLASPSAVRRISDSVEQLTTHTEFEFLNKIDIHGINIISRINDVVVGLRTISERIEYDIFISEHGNQINSNLIGATENDESIRNNIHNIRKYISEAMDISRMPITDLLSLGVLEDLVFQLRRTFDLANQLAAAIPKAQRSAIARLFTALETIGDDFSSVLDHKPNLRIQNAIRKAMDVAGEMFEQISDTPAKSGLSSVPSQQAVAPFQFAISGDRLTLQPQIAHPKDQSELLAMAALRALILQAEDITEDLENSNHPRLFRAFGRLREGLRAGSNIVEIGMLCASFEGQVGAALDELSDSLSALLVGFGKGVMDYASQFKEWQDFSDNAAEASFASKDAENYAKIARVLATELERRHEVDSRVPEALRQVADWNSTTDSPRSRLSLGRTVLNIITVCFNDFVRAPAQTVLKVTGTAVTVIVLHQAALYAAEISKTPEGAWLRPAVRVIENNIGKLEKF
ncbi:hypothetical protein P0M24_18975 [Agrobacterium fabrum]|uniref:hypothetical protein n=1 Tax=Agrobacterium fabrum TaxID=1176649 RepID=UPI0013E8DBA2|nr:hypothetical protein [Agrobacterium fabrum]MCX2875916.1 hypothetical protein [Agrobacterium fabrum]QQN07955.1 hypothetical protein EML4058_17860 [Agrobacterium fabrum]UOG27303.1 hypothetical protein KXJ62_17850 [Agrobacterium fabrum]WEN03135.1 hypothetical protein P0M24_18975 [Agrobacterium fabrum]WER18872.1 hypothetical protein P0252_18975 [Agrobacterium fabrum]